MTHEVERLLNNQFNALNSDGRQRHDPNILQRDMTNMFKSRLGDFLRFLREDLAPKIARLHEVYDNHRFDSALNFIMVQSDFKQFYEDFVEAKLSLLYALELHKDSLFFFSADDKTESIRQQRSREISSLMYKNFENEVSEMAEMLDEY